MHLPATLDDRTVRVVVLFGSVHRYVPPTPGTSGSEAGHSTVGTVKAVPPLPTGAFPPLAVPPSPDEPSTVTPLAAAEMNACRRLCNDTALPNASSADANDCEMTFARWLSITY